MINIWQVFNMLQIGEGGFQRYTAPLDGETTENMTFFKIYFIYSVVKLVLLSVFSGAGTMRQSRTHINTKRYQSANVSRSSKAIISACEKSSRLFIAVGQASDSSVATVLVENVNTAAAVATSPASPRTTSNTAGRTLSFPPYNRISRCTVIGAGGLSASAVVIARYTSYMVVIVFRLLAQRPAAADGSSPSASTAAIAMSMLIKDTLNYYIVVKRWACLSIIK
uniref:Uncharacterized protein n=1 Tax=Schizaphis graminum TaxID=13262 RepID=A0A2S2PJ74_SCHGA